VRDQPFDFGRSRSSSSAICRVVDHDWGNGQFIIRTGDAIDLSREAELRAIRHIAHLRHLAAPHEVSPAESCEFKLTMSSDPIAFGCLLSGVAGFAFIMALRNLVRAKQSGSWPTIDATVIESRVVIVSKGFRPKIVYRYQFGGRNYESARVMIGGMWGTSGDGSARLVQRFAKGSVAAVAVDPKSPNFSVLITGIRFHQVFTAICCAVVFMGTLPVLWAFTQLGIAQ
jgi:hypothetical protein